MKVLIENYANLYTTEPHYFNNALQLAGCESYLWDINIHSAYDILDMVKPDVFIINWNCNHKNDILKYLKENEKCPDIAVNVSKAPQSSIEEFKSIKKCKFLFTNEYHKENLNKKIWLIMPAVDLFLRSQAIPAYLLDAGICSDVLDIQVHNYESYHNLCFGNSDKHDLSVNLFNLPSIYNKYKQFILTGSLNFIFSQIFFDATLRANKVIIKNNPEDNQDVKYILNKIFSLIESADLDTQIKYQLKKEHTCLNRTRQLLSLFDNYEAAKKIDIEINKL